MKAKFLVANTALVISIIGPVLLVPAGTTHSTFLISTAVAFVLFFTTLASIVFATSIAERNFSAVAVSTDRRIGSLQAASIMLENLKVFPRAFVFAPSITRWSYVTRQRGATALAALEAHKQGTYFWAGAACLFGFVLASLGEMGVVLMQISAAFGGSAFVLWALQTVATYAATGLLFFGIFIQLTLVLNGSK